MLGLGFNIIIAGIIGWFASGVLTERTLPNIRRDIHPSSKDDLLSRILFSSLLIISTSLVLWNLMYHSFHSLLLVAIVMIITYCILALLIYLSLNDAQAMEVPLDLSLTYLFALIIINASLILMGGLDYILILWRGNTFIPVQNLISGAVLASAVGLIVILTKEKGMGKADIIFASGMGLLNGFGGSFLGVYIAIFSALVFGVIIMIQRKTYTNVRIPFIPFIAFGTVIGFLLNDNTLLTLLSTLRP